VANILTVTSFQGTVVIMTKKRDYNNLGKWLPVQIEKTGIPMFKVAMRAGVSRASVYAWMVDKTRPDSETMLKFVQVLANLTGQDSTALHAEALSQYINRPEGRKAGADWETAEVKIRAGRSKGKR
jgi:hypothetical protein